MAEETKTEPAPLAPAPKAKTTEPRIELERVMFVPGVKISLGKAEVEGSWMRSKAENDLNQFVATLERDPVAGPVIAFRFRHRDGQPSPEKLVDLEEVVPLGGVASYRRYRAPKVEAAK